MPYSHAVRTNRFYPFRGNGLLLRLPHLHGHKDSAGGSERGKGEPYGRRDRHIGRGKELPPDQSQQGRGKEGRGGWQRAIRTGLTPRKRLPPFRLP